MYFLKRNTFHLDTITYFIKVNSHSMCSVCIEIDWQQQGRIISDDFFSQFLEVSACLPRSQLLGETLRIKSEYCIKGAAVVVSSDPIVHYWLQQLRWWYLITSAPYPMCHFFKVWTSGSEQPARSWRRRQSGDRSLRLKSSESTFDKKSQLSFCENAPIVV